MEFDLNAVDEILVKFVDGHEIVFRGRGLEKFRKLMEASPPLRGLVSPKPKQIVIEEESSRSEDEGSGSEEKPRRPTKQKTKKNASKQNGGYNTVSLDYGGSPVAPNVGGTPGVKKGLSPHDIAKEMQRQATAQSGIKY
jgi:hypothetical protein